MTTKKRVYTPPMARNLSYARARGETVTPLGGDAVLAPTDGGVEPMGICIDGTYHSVSACKVGPGVTGTVSSCNPFGYRPTTPACNMGTSGSAGCMSGSSAVF